MITMRIITMLSWPVCLWALANRRIMILEVKKADSAAGMSAACDEALKQIVDRGYARSIEPGYEKVISYGIAFFRKTAMIKKL